MKNIINIITLCILLAACSHQVHYKDTGLHYDRLGYNSIDFDYKYDTKKKTVKCILRKTKKVPMKGKICIAVFDESRNVVNAKEFNIKDQMKQEVTWHIYQEFTYATCIARVYKK